ncbi:MAG: sigma-70 family RNA polymerase sigma factor [Phycisphaera sp.]|nr:sigma-70 family RNA polymerase sigma factor [Phycisphaera sp.]
MSESPDAKQTPDENRDDAADVISKDAGELYMRLFLANEQGIYSFILSLVHHWADADDLMQETCEVMWRKFEQFEPGSNFTAWAMQIAYFRVLNYRKIKRTARSRLSDANIEALTDRFVKLSDQREARRDALEQCLHKLPEDQRKIIALRYEPDATTQDVADTVGRSIHAVYKALNKTHKALRDCVRQTMAKEARA